MDKPEQAKLFRQRSGKRHNRVRTEAVPGSDPSPGAEKTLGFADQDEPQTSDESAKPGSLEWYQQQKPPHWG